MFLDMFLLPSDSAVWHDIKKQHGCLHIVQVNKLSAKIPVSAIVEHAHETYSRFPTGIPSILMPLLKTGMAHLEEKVTSLSCKHCISHFSCISNPVLIKIPCKMKYWWEFILAVCYEIDRKAYWQILFWQLDVARWIIDVGVDPGLHPLDT